MSNVLHNPQNGYSETFTGMEKILRFFCVLFSGPFWFMVNGMWAWAIIWLFVVLPLSIATCGVSWVLMAFFANTLYRKHLLKNGWVSTEVYCHSVGIGA